MGTKKLGILFLFSVILAFAAGYFSSNLVESKMVIESDEMFKYITKAFDEFYYYDIETDDVYDAFITTMYAAVDAYAQANDDPYTRITSVASDVTSSDAETFVGMGINFTYEDFNLRVNDVYATSDLFGKIFPNDLIVGVIEDDETIYFDLLDSTTEVLTYLDGEIGDEKEIVVENKDGVTSIISFEYVVIDTATTYSVDLGLEDVGYIKIDKFVGYEEGITVGTNYIFNEILKSLESTVLMDEEDTLIIDLRDNPGGDLTALNNLGTNLSPGITQLLLPYDANHSIFNLVNNEDEITEYFGGLTALKSYDIKVLVNENSASASEVLAASLNDYGYELYGYNTYGKGVYQNSIYLNEIQNVRYYLTYTEGVWNYQTDKNVMTDPLLVNQIDQEGILTLDLPVYEQTLFIDVVDNSLIDYQKFLNVYFDLDEGSKMREDGYFDQITKNWIELYQSEKGMTMTGELDILTSQAIYLDFKLLSSDISEDAQLQALLSLLRV